MAIQSPAMHLSSELQGDHDVGIPYFLPVVFAFTSGFINGVLNFGESLSFSLQWNLARHFGWLGPGATFAKGVMLSQVRASLRRFARSCPFGTPCFSCSLAWLLEYVRCVKAECR